jgi:hypothetical protein
MTQCVTQSRDALDVGYEFLACERNVHFLEDLLSMLLFWDATSRSTPMCVNPRVTFGMCA